MRFYHNNRLFKYILPNCIWRVKKSTALYLTFDDGPTPEMTPWVLDLLKQHKVKATFFCVGANVQRHPELYKRILAEGHSVGNHTYSHKSAWENGFNAWFADFERAEKLIDSKLIRPPYGKITPWHVARLNKKGYKVVMWTFITYDFDPKSDPNIALKMMRSLKKGSIIVMHDQPKAEANLKLILPKVFEIFDSKRFESLAMS